MKSSAPLVSIVVPTYNAADYLAQLGASLQAQTLDDFEVILVDDGSTDHTAEVLAGFRNDARFRITVSPNNQGVGRSTLLALGQARGEFWCNPGADDLLQPDFLQERVAWLRSCPEAALVHGLSVTINERGDPIPNPNPELSLPRRQGPADALALLLQHNVINTPTIMVRREVTQAVLPHYAPDWFYAQDWFLWILHAAAGGAFLFDPAKRARYRIHSGSLTFAGRIQAVRRAEIRLVPLCALSVASSLGPDAAALWRRWRRDLYALWLRRAWQLRRQHLLQSAWMERAYAAFHGRPASRPSLTRELLAHLPRVLGGTLHEKSARRHQQFPVSGLARVDHPLLRSR